MTGKERDGTNSGPRDYSVGTERALFRLSQGTCYFPGCPTQIIAMEDGHPIVGVEIAHIKGARPKSARYDSTMTDAERASYPNLILLCVPHHKLVDRIEPKKYPAEFLTTWKHENESEEGIEALRSVVTEANLEDLLEGVAARLGPKRTVEVDLAAGLITGRDGILTMPLESLGSTLSFNPHLRPNPAVIVVNIRNTGNVDVSIAAVDVHYVIEEPKSAGNADFVLLGRNDFGAFNPSLPYRLRDGEAVQWLMKLETVYPVIAAIESQSRTMSALRAKVRIASGEDAASDTVPWPNDLSLKEVEPNSSSPPTNTDASPRPSSGPGDHEPWGRRPGP